MDSENIISWNVANWVSVVLMAFLGFAILAAVASMWRARSGGA